MTILSEPDLMKSDGLCRTCGSHVSHYLCNAICEIRPEAVEWDYWAACDNDACANHYGEGYWQNTPDWEATGLEPLERPWGPVVAVPPGTVVEVRVSDPPIVRRAIRGADSVWRDETGQAITPLNSRI